MSGQMPDNLFQYVHSSKAVLTLHNLVKLKVESIGIWTQTETVSAFYNMYVYVHTNILHTMDRGWGAFFGHSYRELAGSELSWCSDLAGQMGHSNGELLYELLCWAHLLMFGFCHFRLFPSWHKFKSI